MAYGETVENLSREMVLVSHIQRGAVQDGPGWRTTVYLKGCPLRCPWCYNAESLHFQQELRYVPQFCIGAAACGRCLEACRSGGIVLPGPDTDGRPVVRRQLCRVCGECTQFCPSGALSLVGRAMTAADIVQEAEKDRDFYSTSGGGLTLSGGEPLVRPTLPENTPMRNDMSSFSNPVVRSRASNSVGTPGIKFGCFLRSRLA